LANVDGFLFFFSKPKHIKSYYNNNNNNKSNLFISLEQKLKLKFIKMVHGLL